MLFFYLLTSKKVRNGQKRIYEYSFWIQIGLRSFTSFLTLWEECLAECYASPIISPKSVTLLRFFFFFALICTFLNIFIVNNNICSIFVY